MAEEEAQQAGDLEEPQGEPEPDYKALYEKAVAESRKWEKRSKANAEAAKKLRELEDGAESVEERISALEADKKALEDEKARAALVAKVAASTGLSESIVSSLSGADEEALEAQARAVADLMPKGAPSAPEAGTFPVDGGGARTTAQRFADSLDGII